MKLVSENNDKNPAKVCFENPKRTINVTNDRNGKEKDISDYKIVLPNHFQSLSSSKNDRDNFLLDRHALDKKKHAFAPTNIIERSMRLRNSNTRTNTQQTHTPIKKIQI